MKGAKCCWDNGNTRVQAIMGEISDERKREGK